MIGWSLQWLLDTFTVSPAFWLILRLNDLGYSPKSTIRKTINIIWLINQKNSSSKISNANNLNFSNFQKIRLHKRKISKIRMVCFKLFIEKLEFLKPFNFTALAVHIRLNDRSFLPMKNIWKKYSCISQYQSTKLHVDRPATFESSPIFSDRPLSPHLEKLHFRILCWQLSLKRAKDQGYLDTEWAIRGQSFDWFD